MTRTTYETAVREMVSDYARHFAPTLPPETAEAVAAALIGRGDIACFDLVKSIKKEFSAHA